MQKPQSSIRSTDELQVWAGSVSGQLGRLWQMLRCAQIDMKGGEPKFAVGAKVRRQ